MLHYLLTFICLLFCSNHIYAAGAAAPDDFKAMLENPGDDSLNKESFATFVTRPFVASQSKSQNLDFFSNPKGSREDWKKKHKEWKPESTEIDALGVFETMGVSMRGLNDSPAYQDIREAQREGMTRIIAGDLGPQEIEKLAPELLAMGKSLSDPDLTVAIEKLEKAYKEARTNPIKRHLQLSALFMLGSRIKNEGTEWYQQMDDYNEVVQKIERTNHKLFSARPTSPSPAQKTQEYVRDSRILTLYAGPERDKVAKVMAEALSEYVKQNGGKWPGDAQLKVNEQFFWNIGGVDLALDESLGLVKHLFSKKTLGDWESFQEFSDTCLVEVEARQEPSVSSKLFPIFQALTPENRTPFIDFCAVFLRDMLRENRLELDFIAELLPIFQAYPTPKDREPFMAFLDSFLKHVPQHPGRMLVTQLFSIFQAYPTPKDREPFMIFLESSFSYGRVPPTIRPTVATKFFPIFQAISNDPARYDSFISFMHLRKGGGWALIDSYLPRAYLRYMRSLAALNAEDRDDKVRIQALYETDLKQQLPVLWEEDLMLQQVRAMGGGTANAHDFDAVYELDLETLFKWCQDNGYADVSGSVDCTIYNGAVTKDRYHTNVAVEDFITYLNDTVANGPPLILNGKEIQAGRVVSIIKQMLGLEPKTGGTTGGFAPYLAHSMYYAQETAPKGDEMLGRVWFMMKKMGEQAIKNAVGKEDKDQKAALQDLEDYKKSVVLAILEAAELSGGGATTHCQTRMTGELMKAIAWHLPGSKLKPLIAADDLPPAAGDDDIKARITMAPERAKALFNMMKREDSGSLRALLEENDEPELWKRYQAYYDDLYRRTSDGAGGYKKDEHILMRDDHGNLVSLYDEHGALRPTPIIVYYQAEFQMFEQTFAELMRKQFEEQRGLVY